MAGAGAVIGGGAASPAARLMKRREMRRRNQQKVRVVAASATRVVDPYETLRINRRASELEVKKAFRRLALQYHPDVCRGDNCTIKFHQINEAYDVVMANLRGGVTTEAETEEYYDEPMRGMNDPDWDLWEEWMGWEGAGIRDYSSHINPYI